MKIKRIGAKSRRIDLLSSSASVLEISSNELFVDETGSVLFTIIVDAVPVVASGFVSSVYALEKKKHHSIAIL